MRFETFNPPYSISRIRKDLGGLFRGFDCDYQPRNGNFPVQMELIEDEGGFKILADLPGLNKDEIKLMVENDILTISGERTRNQDETSKIHFSERFYGSFSRSFRLTDNIDKTGVSADYKNGILEVVLPKKEETKPKEIEVKVK